MNKNLLILEQEALNENTSTERLEELANISELAHLVAQNVNASPETLTKLANNDSNNVLKALVSNPSTPTEILIELGGEFPEELVKNPIVDFWLLEDNNPFICDYSFQKKLIKNAKTPIKISKILAQHPDFWVRADVASSQNTPASSLEQLANDSDQGVRHNIAKNPNTPGHILKKLATDLPYQVASNPNTPIILLIQFSFNSNYQIRRRADANLNSPSYYIKASLIHFLFILLSFLLLSSFILWSPLIIICIYQLIRDLI